MPKKDTKKRRPLGTTPEAVENGLISLATDLAEKRLRDGTASSQLITHFLKLASSRNQLEQKKIEKEIQLMDSKEKALANQELVQELYENAINAMRRYAGLGGG